MPDKIPTPEPRAATNRKAARCVLGVGIATLDIINEVARYPTEDQELRALAQRIVRGGNCANTLAMLSEFGHHCRWAGTLADDAGGALIRDDLGRRGIGLDAATQVPGGATPTSYITLSRATGSRTIVHHRDLPELTAADFADVDLAGVDWVHLEGRNPVETAQMIARVAAESPPMPISVEIEKPRPEIEHLLRLPDDRRSVLIVSRAYAEQQGATDPETFLPAFAAECSATLVVLPWGAQGAYALTRDGELTYAPAEPPAQIVDTIAAGDVFNAGLIDALLADAPPAEALGHANALAGRSCGQLGIDGLTATTAVLVRHGPDASGGSHA